MAVVMEHNTLVTVATTADQEIHSYTAIADTEMVLLFLGGAYSAWNATEALLGFGRVQFDVGAGWVTKSRTPAFINSDLENNCPMVVIPLMSGHTLSDTHKVRGICNPANATSMRWQFGMWGQS